MISGYEVLVRLLLLLYLTTAVTQDKISAILMTYQCLCETESGCCDQQHYMIQNELSCNFTHEEQFICYVTYDLTKTDLD